MGFIIVTALKWQSPKRGDGLIPFNKRETGRDILVNAGNLSNIRRKTHPESSNVLFDFTENPSDSTEAPTLVEVTDRLAAVTAAIDVAFVTTPTTLVCYDDNDMTKDTYTITVPTNNISFAYPNYNDATTSWVIYRDGGKLKEVLCTSTIAEISGIDWLYDIDGNRYKYVQIGTQYWMIQNLRTTHYADGTAIPEVTDDTLWLADTTGAYCFYENSVKYKEKFGALYNWYAVNHASGLIYFEDEDGVQDANWRVPTVADFDTLVGTVGTDDTAGGYLKERGEETWSDPNTGAVDTYGFRSKSTGNRHVDSEDLDIHGFTSAGLYDDLWTADEMDATDAYSIYNAWSSDNFEDWNHEKYGGMAVRAVRDVTP